MDEPEERPLTFRRALRDKIFWLVALTAAAGVWGVPWWVVVPLTVAGLSIDALPKYLELWPRAQKVGAERQWWMTVALSLFNNLAAACGAYVAGIFTRWLWW